MDKISRTLDKLAQVRREGGREERRGAGGGRNSHSPLVYPMYPGYPPGYRNMRGPQGANYQYVYPPGGHYEAPAMYHEYSATSQSSPGPPPSWCRCPGQGHDSVRGLRGSRCKQCGKARSPYTGRGVQGRPRARLPQGEAVVAAPVTRSASMAAWSEREASVPREASAPRAAGPRDPYDYIRRTRLRADDWDNYWEVGGARETASPRSGRGSARPATQSPQTQARGGAPQTSPQDRSSAAPASPQGRLDLPQMEEEQEESAALTPPPQKERSLTPVKVEPAPAASPGPPAGEGEEREEQELSVSLLVDLATMKSKMSAAEMRYRKFQRRNPLRKLSLQIDDVIPEEDEEALEREDRDSSEDELGLGKFRGVLGSSTNLAEEILSEIYGDSGGEQGLASLSLAEEILEELYGSTTAGGALGEQEQAVNEGQQEEEEENRYCSIEEVLEEEEEEPSLASTGEAGFRY